MRAHRTMNADSNTVCKRATERALPMTPGGFTTRPRVLFYTTNMSLIRPSSILGEDTICLW